MNEYFEKPVIPYSQNDVFNGGSFNTSPTGQTQPFLKKQKPIFDIDKKDVIFFFITAVSLFLFIRVGVFCGFNLGFSISFCILYGCCVIYSYFKKCDNKPFYLLMLFFAVLLAISFTFNTNNLVRFFDLIYLIYLLILSVNGLSGSVKNKDFSYALVIDLMKNSVISAFENLSVPFSSFKASVKSGKSKNALNILLGILIALPTLCIIVPVLSSSDFAFDALVSSVFKNTGLLLVCVVFTVISSPIIYSYIFSLRKGVVKNNGKETVTPSGKISPALLNSFLLCISAAYILFLFSQFAYITDALSFLLPEEFTAAEFARRGFFEMLIISFINLLIICICSFLVKSKNDGEIPIFTKCLLLFICCFSLFYIVSALYRMSLYISLFAYTEARILTSAFMIMLALIFFVMMISLFIRKIPYMKIISVICALTLCVLSFADINSLVVRLNYKAYDENFTMLDVEEIRNCHTGMEELLKIYDDDKLKDGKLENMQHYEAAAGIVDIIYENFELPGDDFFAVEELSIKEIQKLHNCKNIFEYNYNNYRNIRLAERLIKEQPEKLKEIFKFYYEYDFSDYIYEFSDY